jgi:hypothetical protein
MKRLEITLLLASSIALSALLTGGAAAQFVPGISLGADPRPLTAEEKQKRKDIDDAYRSAVAKVPDQKKSSDPWGGIRTTTTTQSKKRQQ